MLKRLILGIGALIIAPVMLSQCAIALYNGLVLGDFAYVGYLANSLEFAVECVLLNMIAILSFLGGSEE